MSNTNSPLIEAIIFQSTLCLQVNQDDNFGVIDFERFQSDMAFHLKSIDHLEEELDNVIDELEREVIASKVKDEEIRALKSICLDLQGAPKSVYDFCLDHLN